MTPPDSLTSEQHREVQQVAELEVRRYFDHYLHNVWPTQQDALETHCRKRIERHDLDKDSHGGVERKVNRFGWVLIGVVMASGATGVGMARLLMSILA